MVGILALQGDVREHQENLQRHGMQSTCIRRPSDFDGIDALILPGGESTTIQRLIISSGLLEPVKAYIQKGLPLWGTCAGVVLLAKGGLLECVEILVDRNAYGSQLYSRVAKGKSQVVDGEISMAFIRAPRIRSDTGNVEVLCRLDGYIVAIRQRNILLTTFHPELTPENPFTSYFIDMVRISKHAREV